MKSGFDNEQNGVTSVGEEDIGKVKVDAADTPGYLGNKLIAGNNISLNTSASDITISANVASVAGHQIANEGSQLPLQPTLDFVGTGVHVTDDAGNNKTIVEVEGIEVSTPITDTTLTCEAGYHYVCNGVTTANLPAGVQGMVIGFADYGDTFSGSPLTITANAGDTIVDDTATTLVLDKNASTVMLGFCSDRWILLAAETSTEPAFGAYSESVTTAFTIPALSATATQAFDNVTWVSMGQAVFLSDGTNYGYFTVTGIDSELGTLILENTWGETNGSEIAIGAKLSPAGVRGVQGIQGIAGNDGANGSDGSNGTDGKSAYEIAVEQGFIGDVNEWLVHITGTDGVDGADGSNGSAGLTAYEVAINNGFVGTEQEWLDSLVGPQGEQGIQGIQGIQGVKGDDGESAYDVAVRNGYSDSEPIWLDSLVGPQGLSAYEVAVSNGFVGTEQEWLASLEYNSDGSANAYTTAEKDKLAGIEEGATADQTGAEIKALYEAQPDTNAYTDTELAKVASLYYLPTDIKTSAYTAVSGEEVRCDTTAGAFNVTLPATGALRIVDVRGTDYTSGFGANHLTILPAGGDTIVGEASLELDVGLTSVTLLRIGTDWTVVDLDGAAFRVIDWGEITNKPTLATVAQGALADTALQPTETETVSGNYTFNGALYLPNNSRINNIEHFYQTTKPTTRGDSSALVIGDRWWKTDDGTEWFWNGTYWLTCQTYHTADQVASASTLLTSTSPGLRYTNPNAGSEPVFVETCWIYKNPGGTNINSGTAEAYYTYRFGYHNTDTTPFATIHSVDSYTISSSSRYRFDVNTLYTVTGFSMLRTINGLDIGGYRMGVTYRIVL